MVKPPPPIYIKGVLDFQGLCTKLIELIGVDNFICKSTIDRHKIQTKHPESYRATIQLLKENKAEYHTYQLKEDKPLRVVIRNLHPSTKTETIKENYYSAISISTKLQMSYIKIAKSLCHYFL